MTAMPMSTRRNVVLWVLYDFANSIVSITFFLYFAQWAVIDKGIADFHFNLAFTFSALLLLLTVPVTGVLLDASLKRITGLRYATAATAILYGSCALFAVAGNAWGALACFAFGLYAYLLSFTFYTPLMNDISSPERRGRISGLGIAANYAGQFAGLLIALPFSKGAWSLFHAAPRAETLLPAVLIFLALSLPTLIWFEEPRRASGGLSFRAAMKAMARETRDVFSYPGIALFLGAYFLFNDAVLTVSNNFPIFLEQVWHVSDTVKTYLLLGILVTCGIGGIVSGRLADRYGHKRTLYVVLCGWVVLLPLVGLLLSFPLFVFATVMMGFWFGATWTVSRSVMGELAPSGKHNLAFAYFGLAERASSFVGPIAWGLMVSGLSGLGSARYRVAIVMISTFIIFGVVLLRRVPAGKE